MINKDEKQGGRLPETVGPYRLEGLLGEGAMARVYRAVDLRSGETVALKILRPEAARDSEKVRRFHEEGRIMEMLEHPHIVKALPSGVDGGLHYIPMEYVDGITLSTRLKDREKLPAQVCLAIIAACARALDYAHGKGIVHRDVKPSNIIIARNGTVKLMDFGLAKDLAVEKGLTVEGFYLGTPHYSSPEQWMGVRLDGGTDIWSLGVVLFEMLVGTLPFDGKDNYAILCQIIQGEAPSPSMRDPRVPAALDGLVSMMMAKDRKHRPGSCRALLDIMEMLPGEGGESHGRKRDFGLFRRYLAPALRAAAVVVMTLLKSLTILAGR